MNSSKSNAFILKMITSGSKILYSIFLNVRWNDRNIYFDLAKTVD